MKSSVEISQQIADKERELKEALNTKYIIETEKLNISKDIIVLYGKKKEIELILLKSDHNCREIGIDIKLLTKEFWSTKNEGL